MKALIVYDSFFGNTEEVAKTIGTALSESGFVSVVKVGEFKSEHLEGIDLLILGSPTRAFSSSPATKAFLKGLPANALQGVKVAAFDTRIALEDVHNKFLNFMVKLFGYAAEPMAKALQKKGGVLAIPPDWFYVKGSEGPLKDGELERAGQWAKTILSA